jgi:hypothetical protein
MPQEGAAILSQVEGLLEQFLALDYETPVKDVVESQLLPAVQQGMDQLRSDAAGMEQSPEGGDQGLLAGVVPPPEEEAPVSPPQHTDMGAARDQALNDMTKKEGSFRGEGPKSRGEKRKQAADEEQRRKKSKAK